MEDNKKMDGERGTCFRCVTDGGYERRAVTCDVFKRVEVLVLVPSKVREGSISVSMRN